MWKQNGHRGNDEISNRNDDDFTYLNQVKAAKGGVFGLSNTTITAERKKSYNLVQRT